MSKDGGPAFPVEVAYDGETGKALPLQTSPVSGWHNGMTLRDYFAGQALAGAVLNRIPMDTMALRAYQLADAMLAARGEG